MNIQWIFSVMAVWLVVPWAFGQSTERFERVAKEYGWEAWKGTNATQYVNRLPSWHIPSLKIDTGGRKVEMVKEVRSERELNDVILDGRPVCRIESVVCPDVISAQRRLVQEFSKMTIRSKFDVLSFGDRGYGLAEGMSWRFALFARNNVFVSVMSYDRTIPAAGLAVQIDQDILSKSNK